MSLDFTKVTYVDGETVIGADNLNDIQDAILDLDENKVEKEQGKGLSENDYTDTDKEKVDNAYVVPEGGIPKSALADAVQTSLDKADTALQEDDLEDKASVPVTVGPSAIATFESSFVDAPIKSLTVNIEPAQSGSGDPSPTNIRTISGWTGCNIYHSGADMSNPTTHPITFPTEAGTVYGGTLTINADGSGELVVDRVSVLIGELGAWEYQSNNNRFYNNANLSPKAAGHASTSTPAPGLMAEIYTARGLTATSTGAINNSVAINNVGRLFIRDERFINVAGFLEAVGNTRIVYMLDGKQTYQLAAEQITTLLGTNNIWADCGDVTVTYGAYLKDIKDYADQVDSGILSAVAPLEETYTASRNYAVGSYLFVGTKFYKVTSAIQTGGTINPGTNVAQTTVAEQLMTLAVKPAILG